MQATTSRHARDHFFAKILGQTRDGPKILAKKSIPKTVVKTPAHSDSGLPFRNWIIANLILPYKTLSGLWSTNM